MAELEPDEEVEAELEHHEDGETELQTGSELVAVPVMEPELEAEREPETAWAEPEPEVVAVPVREPALEAEQEPEAAWTGPESETELAPETEFVPTAAFVPAAEREPDAELEPHAEFLPHGELETDMELEPARSRGPVHARTRRTDTTRRPSRVFIATAVLAGAFLLIVSIVAIAHSLHHTPTAGTPTSTPSTASSSPETARIQSATDSVDSATTSASGPLAATWSAFPTPTNVADVINPYVASLQLYETFMSGAAVPQPARSAATTAVSEVRQDVTTFSTIDGLPPIRLGAYLQEFAADVTKLQTSLSTLEQALRTPAQT